jgi:thiosulfate/3-mercaptopyruvate sulfurtransferase
MATRGNETWARRHAGTTVSLAILGAVGATTLVSARPATAIQATDRPVVSVAWLAQHLNDPEVILLHVGERAQYDREHIPGARFVQLRDLAVERDGLTLELPAPDQLRDQLERLGIGDKSRVVVYFGEDWFSPTTRVLFTLDAAGLGSRSALLDGGMPAWKRSGNPVTAEVPPVRRGVLRALRASSLVVDAAWIRSRVRAPGVAIVDARTPRFYGGPAHGEHRAGHLPGASNIPFSAIADEQLQLLPEARLQALFREAGVQPGDTVVAYCHIGQQATAVALAARMLGHPVRLYDGSFEDWSRRADLPVEQGGSNAKPR